MSEIRIDPYRDYGAAEELARTLHAMTRDVPQSYLLTQPTLTPHGTPCAQEFSAAGEFADQWEFNPATHTSRRIGGLAIRYGSDPVSALIHTRREAQTLDKENTYYTLTRQDTLPMPIVGGESIRQGMMYAHKGQGSRLDEQQNYLRLTPGVLVSAWTALAADPNYAFFGSAYRQTADILAHSTDPSVRAHWEEKSVFTLLTYHTSNAPLHEQICKAGFAPVLVGHFAVSAFAGLGETGLWSYWQESMLYVGSNRPVDPRELIHVEDGNAFSAR